jgi:hypothetical protein
MVIVYVESYGESKPMGHAYNPSYSGGRDQEVHPSKPAWSSKPYREKTLHKKGLV